MTQLNLENIRTKVVSSWIILLILTISGSITYSLLRSGGYSENVSFLLVTGCTILGVIPVVLANQISLANLVQISGTTATVSSGASIASTPNLRIALSTQISSYLFFIVIFSLVAGTILYFIRNRMLHHKINQFLHVENIQLKLLTLSGELVFSGLAQSKMYIRTYDGNRLELRFRNLRELGHEWEVELYIKFDTHTEVSNFISTYDLNRNIPLDYDYELVVASNDLEGEEYYDRYNTPQ